VTEEPVTVPDTTTTTGCWHARHMSRTFDTGTDELLARAEDGVAVITFNRPERRNALADSIYIGFGRVLPAIAVDPDIRVVMVTGAGGAFCAGGDVKAFRESHLAGAREGRPTGVDDQIAYLRQRQREVSFALHHLSRPVVAALPGAAAGAGLSIALAADIRLAAERAILVPAFATIGASGDFGGSWFLTNLVGPAKAKELYWTSPRLSAADALAMGLVNQVLPDDDFEAAALDYCRDLASRSPVALRLMKENINRALTCDLGTALDAEAPNMVRSMSTADHREATAAFLEKRPPVFRGE
jgi:2-(1,2-epoxy-1,2-dihydrophenyl)acetyl-CoA isomerase